MDLQAERPCSKWINYEFAYTEAGSVRLDERFEVLGCSCVFPNTAGFNLYGRVTDGQLTVKGAAIAMVFTYGSFYEMFKYVDGEED